MRADIHDGPEHNTLQSEAGYIDARPKAARSMKTSCDARPDHTNGSIAGILDATRTRRLHLNERTWNASKT